MINVVNNDGKISKMFVENYYFKLGLYVFKINVYVIFNKKSD